MIGPSGSPPRSSGPGHRAQRGRSRATPRAPSSRKWVPLTQLPEARRCQIQEGSLSPSPQTLCRNTKLAESDSPTDNQLAPRAVVRVATLLPRQSSFPPNAVTASPRRCGPQGGGRRPRPAVGRPGLPHRPSARPTSRAWDPLPVRLLSVPRPSRLSSPPLTLWSWTHSDCPRSSRPSSGPLSPFLNTQATASPPGPCPSSRPPGVLHPSCGALSISRRPLNPSGPFLPQEAGHLPQARTLLPSPLRGCRP